MPQLTQPIFVSFTPGENLVARYTRERHAPRRMIRTHVGRIGTVDPSRTLADVMHTFRATPPKQCEVQ